MLNKNNVKKTDLTESTKYKQSISMSNTQTFEINPTEYTKTQLQLTANQTDHIEVTSTKIASYPYRDIFLPLSRCTALSRTASNP